MSTGSLHNWSAVSIRLNKHIRVKYHKTVRTKKNWFDNYVTPLSSAASSASSIEFSNQ